MILNDDEGIFVVLTSTNRRLPLLVVLFTHINTRDRGSSDLDINLITNDEWDRDSGTAEFKAAAIRVEKLRA